MKISQIKIRNLRGYSEEAVVDIENLVAFVGKNDAGKSTILEALDVFFNEGKGLISLDKEDFNKAGLKQGDGEIVISVVFEDLPDQIVIDDTNKTNLSKEYLLNGGDKLEVVKKYNGISRPKEKVYIRARHPTNSKCSELLLKKQKDLQQVITKNGIACSDQRKNAVMREAIWSHYKADLQIEEVEIDVTKEDAKNIWEKLKEYMPLYALFQSDRKNSDGDSEIQDPMALAIQEILRSDDVKKTLDGVATQVNSELQKVVNNTLDKLKDMAPEIAGSLKPNIPASENLKWATVFKDVSISGDEGILVNKRGSGVKRMILINFFRAEVERRQAQENAPDVIYAMEEPEASQHFEHQNKLMEALIALSGQEHTQIILTTHSPGIVKMLDFCNLKLVEKRSCTKVVDVQENDLPYPSLNEVVYLAFNEAGEEYHNELYGFIEYKNWLDGFKENKELRLYRRSARGGGERKDQVILSEYIRHQIHHPENTRNERFSKEELLTSIEEMRRFIKSKDGS